MGIKKIIKGKVGDLLLFCYLYSPRFSFDIVKARNTEEETINNLAEALEKDFYIVEKEGLEDKLYTLLKKLKDLESEIDPLPWRPDEPLENR